MIATGMEDWSFYILPLYSLSYLSPKDGWGVGRISFQESSNGWNNAGTGHSALCEPNYTPEVAGDGLGLQMKSACRS